MFQKVFFAPSIFNWEVIDICHGRIVSSLMVVAWCLSNYMGIKSNHVLESWWWWFWATLKRRSKKLNNNNYDHKMEFLWWISSHIHLRFFKKPITFVLLICNSKWRVLWWCTWDESIIWKIEYNRNSMREKNYYILAG